MHLKTKQSAPIEYSSQKSWQTGCRRAISYISLYEIPQQSIKISHPSVEDPFWHSWLWLVEIPRHFYFVSTKFFHRQPITQSTDITMGFVQVSQVLIGLLALQPALIAGLPAPEPAPSPPGIPSAATARSELASLTVAAQGSQDGYSRAKFPHWIKQSG